MILAAAILLVVADATYQERHGATLAEWYHAVAAEKNFDGIEWEWAPRSSPDDPDRLSKIAAVTSRIKAVRPTTVQIFGPVAHPASGHGVPDGHTENWQVYWTDVPYMLSSSYTHTDTRTFTTNGLPTMRNVPGDGRWDVNYYTGKSFYGPIARLSFANLNGNRTQPTTFPCYTGIPVPPIDEHEAFADYMRRNLDYRQGRRPIDSQVVWSQRPDFGTTKSSYRQMLAWLPWVDCPTEIHDTTLSARFWFSGTMPEHWWLSFYNAACEKTRLLVFINYRSNAWEWYGWRQGLPRVLTFGPLVSLWSDRNWRFGPEDRIVADSIWRTWLANMAITGVGVMDMVAGDITLPYLDYPSKVSALKIISR